MLMCLIDCPAQDYLELSLIFLALPHSFRLSTTHMYYQVEVPRLSYHSCQIHFQIFSVRVDAISRLYTCAGTYCPFILLKFESRDTSL